MARLLRGGERCDTGVHFVTTASQREILERIAQREGRSLGDVIRRMLDRGLTTEVQS